MSVMSPEQYLADLNPAQREAVLHAEGPLLVIAGAGSGQDARPHPPRRPPDRGARDPPVRDPRDHLHQQGRRRDAQPARQPPRPVRARALDPHVPRRLRPHPPPRGAAARLPLQLHHLRPGRPGAPRQALPGGARARPEAVRPTRHPRADLQREEPADRAGGVPLARRLVLRPDGRGRLRAVPASPVRLERGRLRRHADADRGRAGALPRVARALAERLPLRARRRVPGHEPCAVPAAAAALGRAPKRLRRRRPGPVDLQLQKRRHPQHPRLRGRLPRGADDRARAELPLDQLHPRIGEPRHLVQPRAQAEEPLVGARRGRPGARDRGRGRARRGALRRRADRPARRAGPVRERDRGLLPDERPVAGAGGRARPPGRALPGDRRPALLRARRDQGSDRVPPGDRQPGRRGLARPDREPAAPRDRRRVPRPAAQLRRAPRADAVRGALACGRGRPRRRSAPRRQVVRDADAVAPVPGAGADRARAGRAGARAQRLHRVARGRAHRRGAGAQREPPGARRGHPRIPALRPRSRACPTSSRRSRSTPTRTRSARSRASSR